MKEKEKHTHSTLFVTVGSTRFDRLVNYILSDEFINILLELRFKRLIVQSGQSAYDKKRVDVMNNCPLDVTIYDYKSSIVDDIKAADVVIGHAGAGTCLEVLRLRKKLIVIANESLMDNHQNELAEQLSEDLYAIQATLDNLGESLIKVCRETKRLRPFPAADPAKFEDIFNEALRKVSSRL